MWNATINLEWRNVCRGQGLFIKESQAVLVGKGTLSQRLVEDAIAATQHGLVVDTVGKADARAEGLGIDILRALPSVAPAPSSEVCVRPENITCPRVWESWIYRREAVERFCRWQVNVVAQAIIHS